MKISAWVLLALAATVSVAAAQGTPQQQAACRGDARRLCADLGQAGADAYRQCLQAHFDELSPRCQRVMSGGNG